MNGRQTRVEKEIIDKEDNFRDSSAGKELMQGDLIVTHEILGKTSLKRS